MSKNKNSRQAALKITNEQLALLVVFLLALGIAVFYATLFASSSQQQWLKLQANNFIKTIPLKTTKPPAATPAVAEQAVRIPILVYHHVGPLPAGANQLRRDMTVSAEKFELQIAWLKTQGFESIALKNFLAYKTGNFTLPSQPVILTFDDGYRDVFEYAVPILEKYGFLGSFAVITQFVGLKQGTNEYATWQQIRQAQKQGMEIISHTQDHFDGTDKRYQAAFILRNLTDARKDLKDHLGRDSRVLVYPYGHYHQQYLQLARQAGIELGLTTNFGIMEDSSNLLEIPRVRIGGGLGMDSFARLLSVNK